MTIFPSFYNLKYRITIQFHFSSYSFKRHSPFSIESLPPMPFIMIYAYNAAISIRDIFTSSQPSFFLCKIISSIFAIPSSPLFLIILSICFRHDCVIGFIQILIHFLGCINGIFGNLIFSSISRSCSFIILANSCII